MGESLGGLAAALTAVHHPELAGLVLWYPALTAPKLAERFTPGGEEWGMPFPKKFLSDLKGRDTLSPLPRCGMPVLLLHGDEDATVPLEVSRQAVDLFPNACLAVLPGAGHGFEGTDRMEAFARTAAFVQHLSR